MIPKYCCIFDITHRQAELVQRAIEEFTGDWKFSKREDYGPKTAVVYYCSSRVNVIVVKNPDNTLVSRNRRVRKSYIRFATAGYCKEHVNMFLDMVRERVPEISNNHKIRQLGVESSLMENDKESIEQFIDD